MHAIMENFYLNRILRSYSKIRLLGKWAKRIYNRPEALKFMAGFIEKGDIVFDIGANYGWKTELFLLLGATVIAVEPQHDCLGVLKRKFKTNDSVRIEPVALGAEESVSHIWKSDVRNQLSSMSKEWISAVKDSGRFQYFEWSSTQAVNVTTLDILINRHGAPSFCKIDTEGYELEVIKGLTRPIRVISFEYHMEFMDSAIGSVERISSLGNYEFNYTVGEQPYFTGVAWHEPESLVSAISSKNSSSLNGDIYARLT